ncbi:MAG: DUF3488 and transglutaminase-like domain-containing protein [Planctomycetes bacterium]|nr:DUF3488 and transglutaminase-like domain-containing protein [Planctomycetota bacterium]
MQLLQAFRLSTYLTLALACLCLGYAEEGLLPETPYITASVIVLIAVAYQFEGRWSLSLQSANMVGAVLTIALVGWLVFQFVRSSPGLLEVLPFPANLLPYLGPVLMILVPAKLFRPKHVGDFWAMQGIGLLAVTLGCAMANDLFFAFLLVAYVFSFAWSLTLFHLYRVVRPTDPPPGTTAAVGEPLKKLRLGRLAIRWSLGITMVSLLLFLVTPRPRDRSWELSMVLRGRMETGHGDGQIDLNRTGSLEQNHEIAFEVYADDAVGNPIFTLLPNQRWRTSALSHYENGRWLRDRTSGLIVLERTSNSVRRGVPGATVDQRLAQRNARLPDFGPEAIYLRYRLHRNVGAYNIVADPVIWRSNDSPPILVLEGIRGAVQQKDDGQFEWYSPPAGTQGGYTQITLPLHEPDLGPPIYVSNKYQDTLTRITNQAMAERVRNWTSKLLERLVQNGKLAEAAIRETDPFTRAPLAKNHEAISRALQTHLSESGEFIYTLQLSRKDKSIDPVEDFLFNTKAGHCQRFASALVLMLRSQGIPSQIVLGFRGCESRGDGWYDVRQLHAHAWAEVLVTRSPPVTMLPRRANALPPDPKSESIHWLSLDPTPLGDAQEEEANGFSNWLQNVRVWGESMFRNFVISYDTSTRERVVKAVKRNIAAAAEDIRDFKHSWPWLLFSGLGVGLVFVGCRWRFRQDREGGDGPALKAFTPMYARLLELLAGQGFVPRPGQTAREFTEEVAESLARESATVEVVDVPPLLADSYYRIRFGDWTPSDEERRSFDAALARLEAAFANCPIDGR